MAGYTGKQTYSGKEGQMWLDDVEIASIIEFEANVTINYTDVPRNKELFDDRKMTGLKGEGKFKLHKLDSTMQKALSPYLKSGKNPSFKIISKLDDADAAGAERIACYNCTLDKLILAGWSNGSTVDEEYNFQFTDYDLLDTV